MSGKRTASNAGLGSAQPGPSRPPPPSQPQHQRQHAQSEAGPQRHPLQQRNPAEQLRQPAAAPDPSTPPSKKPRYADAEAPDAQQPVHHSTAMESVIPAAKPSVFAPSMGGRRFEVRKRRTTPTRSDLGAFYAKGLQQLDAAVGQVLVRGWPDTSKEILYRMVEDLCRGHKQDDLYALIKRQLENHLKSVVRPRLAKDDSWVKHNEDDYEEHQLKSLLREWDEWQSRIVSICFPKLVTLIEYPYADGLGTCPGCHHLHPQLP